MVQVSHNIIQADHYQKTFYPMINCHPFQISVPDETLEAVRKKVAAFPWHEMPDDGGWGYGANLDYMREFADYWVNKFN